MYLNRRVFGFIGPVRAWVAATTAAALLASVFSILVAFGLSGTVGAILASFGGPDATDPTGTADPGDRIAPQLALTAVWAVARAICLWARDQLAVSTAARVKRALRETLMHKVYELGPGHQWRGGRGSLQTRIVDGVEHLQAYIGFYLPQLLVSWLAPVAVVVVLLFVDPLVAAVVGIGVATVSFARRMWRFVLRNRAQDHWEQYGRFAARLADSIGGMPTLIALGAVGRRRRHLSESAEELRRATTANMRASLGVSAVMTTAMAVGTAGATVLAAFNAARGALDASAVLLVLFLAAEAFRPQQELSGYWHEGFYGIAAADGVAELLAAEPAVTDQSDQFDQFDRNGRTARVEFAAAPSVEFAGVSYRYPGTDRDVLENISFAVPAGSVLAVVGRSGAGKSTLGRLLLRDLDPDRGRVLLDGRDAREYALARLRRLTARVAQDVVLLAGSVRENVALAAADPDPDVVERAIDDARMREFADVLRDGLDSQVGEGGRLLSGGQRQRVALARALVADAKLLLLDEATSALDAENEELFTRVLDGQRGRRTTIVIAHRLSTVAGADHVLVLADGRVAEFGPPDELAERGGEWAAMLAAQQAAALVGPGGGAAIDREDT